MLYGGAIPITHTYQQLHARLRDTCKYFFDRYAKAGGDPDNVIVLLWFLTAHFTHRERLDRSIVNGAERP